MALIKTEQSEVKRQAGAGEGMKMASLINPARTGPRAPTRDMSKE